MIDFNVDKTVFLCCSATAFVPWPDEEADVTFLGLMPTSKKKAFCERESATPNWNVSQAVSGLAWSWPHVVILWKLQAAKWP